MTQGSAVEVVSPLWRLRRPSRGRRPSVLIGLSFGAIGVVLICVVFGPWIAPHSADAQDLTGTYLGPSSAHLFGTDALGRDIFSRTIVGARLALIGPVVIAVGQLVIGSALGLLAGYFGGAIDFTIMRWADIMFALPGILLVIVVAGVIGGGYWTAVFLILFVSVPFDARMIRACVIEQRPRPYVEAARVLGVGKGRIMLHHIWPNVLAIVVAITFLDFAGALVGLAGLSYIGLGAAPGAADWGRMIADNRNLLFDNALAPLGPALFLVVTAVSMNLIGDWLYERVADQGRAR